MSTVPCCDVLLFLLDLNASRRTEPLLLLPLGHNATLVFCWVCCGIELFDRANKKIPFYVHLIDAKVILFTVRLVSVR